MSTHFHLIAEGNDIVEIEQFMTLISRCYSLHFRKKYHTSIPSKAFEIQFCNDYQRFPSKKNLLLYVLRNPVHHYAADIPLVYEYSSAKYIFCEQILGKGNYKHFVSTLVPLKDLPKRTLHKIIGDMPTPADYLYSLADETICPISFLDIPKVRNFWDTVKQFFFEMNTLPKDVSDEVIKIEDLEKQVDKYSDLEICEMVDEYVEDVGATNFLTLNETHRSFLRSKLLALFVSRAQIDRCLW